MAWGGGCEASAALFAFELYRGVISRPAAGYLALPGAVCMQPQVTFGMGLR